MGRNKCVMEKIEDPTSRQRTYSKRKDSFVKKAKALATLCDTDVAFLMFSPTGQVTSYSSRGSVEDVMLRIVNNPHLSHSLTQSKYEGQMVEKIAAHEAELMKLNQRVREAQEKIRYYEPQVENISSVQEADAYQKFLTSAMEQIQRSQERLLGCEGFVQGIENVVVASVNTADTTYAAGTSTGYML
ncbi:hypothetical protein P3S67_016158 [Capsicum chacoense]